MNLKKDSRDCDALNCLGFLHLIGAKVEKNEELAKLLFHRSASYGNQIGKYISYMQWNDKRMDELFRIANEGYGNAINYVGFEIGEEKINLEEKTKEIEYLLYRLASF